MILRNEQTGFSLVETLVAVTILIIAVTAPITIVVRSTQGSQFSSEQVIATYLAQEGLELAKKIRDDAYLSYVDALESGSPPNPTPWEDNFSNPAASPYSDCFSSAGCGLYIENVGGGTNVNGMIRVTNDTCGGATCLLYFDDGGANTRSRYTHESAGNTAAKYTRTIRFEQLPMSNVPGSVANPEIRLISIVTWRTGTLLAEQQVVTQTSLLNLYDLP